MYFGYFEHTLDDKGRLSLPKRIKEGLLENASLYVLKGFEGCLSVYNESEFNKLCQECEKISFNHKNSRSYLRIVLSSVVQLNLDKVGRIQLPSQILSKYNIKKDVVILGVGDHFEIWDSEIYKAYELDANENFESIAEKMEEENGK